MYEGHFGLQSRPFRAGPDHASYFPAAAHESGLNRLERAVLEGEGLSLVTGTPGVGKTLICHCLVHRLGNEVRSAFVPNTHALERIGLLQAVLFDLNEEYVGRSEQELRLGLTNLLLKHFAEGRPTLIVVDEAQNLGADLFEELRLLSNLEIGSGRAVHILLSAQTELSERLRTAEYALFGQRLSTRVQLEPLTKQECIAYVKHQLRMAGGGKEIFTDEALDLIASAGGGIPRSINQLAHHAMGLAHACAATTVDAEAVTEALGCLGIESSLVEDGGAMPRIAQNLEKSSKESKPVRKPGRRRIPISGEPKKKSA